MSAPESTWKAAGASPLFALPLLLCGCIIDAEAALDAVEDLGPVEAASQGLCGRGDVEPPDLAATVQGDAQANAATGELSVHAKKSGADEEHERAKLTAFIPSPDAAGQHHFSASIRMLEGFVHQTGFPLFGGYSQSGIELQLRVLSRNPATGNDDVLCEDSIVWQKGGEPSAHIALRRETHHLDCSFFSLRGAPNLRAETTLHGWAIAGGIAGAEASAVARLEEVEFDLCSDD